MSNTPTIRVELLLPLDTWQRLQRLTALQNANIHNNASRMINAGIDAALERWPNLKKEMGE